MRIKISHEFSFTIKNPLVPVLIYFFDLFYKYKYRDLIGLKIALYNKDEFYVVGNVCYTYYHTGILEPCVELWCRKYGELIRLETFLKKMEMKK